jgi:hypothetical protein
VVNANTPLYHKGYIYTVSGYGTGGQMFKLSPDGMLYCYGENGEVALVKPNPKKFAAASSFKIDKGSGPHWAHPVIKNGRPYIRHGGVLMVYDIAR